MHYSNNQLQNFVDKIKLSQEQKDSYSSQINNLKDHVLRAISQMDETKVIKFKRAGSWKKGTVLAPGQYQPLDIDMVFFMDVDDKQKFDAEEVRDGIINVLCRAYQNKNRSDFTNGKKTVGIVFRGSGLEVDIVPFIPEKGNSTYGRQPRKKLNSGEFKTSVDKQLEFFQKIKRKYRSFTSVVRILKRWKNYKELNLPSFSIEIVVAYLVTEGRLSGSSINEAIIQFFEFLGNGQDVKVYFSGVIGKIPCETPWIADPTNNENNSLYISDDEWDEIVDEAEHGFNTISYAMTVSGTGNTRDLWKEIFGPDFDI